MSRRNGLCCSGSSASQYGRGRLLLDLARENVALNLKAFFTGCRRNKGEVIDLTRKLKCPQVFQLVTNPLAWDLHQGAC